jgi:hypothetical protein
VDRTLALLTQLAEPKSPVQKMARDALEWWGSLRQPVPEPRAWTDGSSEVGLRWIAGQRHALAIFEGDGEFGYAMLTETGFQPGAEDGTIKSGMPADLGAYLDDLARLDAEAEQRMAAVRAAMPKEG